ncbi:hypothetical protein ACFLYW_01355, partial [Thermodesulfobacteriota bacterium]
MEPVDSLKAKVVDAHGGVDALGQISTLVFSGKITTKKESGTVALTLSRPGKLRATMVYTQKYEDRILLDNQGWRDFGDGFKEVSDHSLGAMIFQYNHLNLPMGIFDKKYKILHVDQKIEGQAFSILELIAKNEPPMAVIIDQETGLIRQINGKILMGKNEVVMGVGYRDYKKVNDVMLPSRIINYVNGKAIAESRYDAVQLNVELDSKF